jgi:hypothetical protein
MIYLLCDSLMLATAYLYNKIRLIQKLRLFHFKVLLAKTVTFFEIVWLAKYQKISILKQFSFKSSILPNSKVHSPSWLQIKNLRIFLIFQFTILTSKFHPCSNHLGSLLIRSKIKKERYKKAGQFQERSFIQASDSSEKLILK